MKQQGSLGQHSQAYAIAPLDIRINGIRCVQQIACNRFHTALYAHRAPSLNQTPQCVTPLTGRFLPDLCRVRVALSIPAIGPANISPGFNLGERIVHALSQCGRHYVNSTYTNGQRSSVIEFDTDVGRVSPHRSIAIEQSRVSADFPAPLGSCRVADGPGCFLSRAA